MKCVLQCVTQFIVRELCELCDTFRLELLSFHFHGMNETTSEYLKLLCYIVVVLAAFTYGDVLLCRIFGGMMCANSGVYKSSAT